MSTLLIRNADVLVTLTGEEIEGGGVFAENGWLKSVGPSDGLPTAADEVYDATGHIVAPGLVNTHHHLYQTLTRVFPGAQDVGLFSWLKTLYPVWARMTPHHVRVATRLGLVELALSGATTVFDHQYLWPNGSKIDDQFEGADGLNMRFHVSRGSMSLGESRGGLPPDSLVEEEDQILDDTQRAIEAFHDSSRGAMRQVVVAPCSPFSVTSALMKESADLARATGVKLHTHLAETHDEEHFCLQTFDLRPVAYMESVGWAGEDVCYAHAVHVGNDEVSRMGDAGTGVSHCPTSNMRLASGIAPVGRYLGAGVPVGLGVDGSASNDSSHMLAELRQALLLNRLAVAPGVGDGDLIDARTVLEMATIGGAGVLGRTDIGKLEPGRAADLIAVPTETVAYSGAGHDLVAGLVFCAPQGVADSWVHGRPLVAGGRVVGVDHERLIAEHSRLAQVLAS